MKNLHFVRRTVLSAAATAVLAFPLFASASVLNAPDAQRVSVGSLDLTNERDQQELYQRLQDKSREVCGYTNLRITGSVERSISNEECYQGTLTAAVERVDSEALTQLHNQ